MTKHYQQKFYPLMIFLLICKICLAGVLELGNDEVYYWTYALQPDLNHFDHPPMVGFLIRFTTLNLYWVSEISLRLGAILGSLIASWFIFQTGKIIESERLGWYALLIYHLSIYTGLIAGLFILPDSPQMPFWTASIYLMARIVFLNQEKNTKVWLGLAICIGSAILCKIHGLYLIAGFGLFILLYRRAWLLNWRLYFMGMISSLFLVPILLWNIDNDFITYQFHSERVTQLGIRWDYFFQEILGEIIYQHPMIWFLILFALISLFRGKIAFKAKETKGFLFSLSLPMLFLFWGIALRNPTLPHWAGPAYIPLFFIAALWLSKKRETDYPRVLKYAGYFLISLLLIVVLVIRFSPINFGSKHQENYGEYCPTLDLNGWTEFSHEFKTLVTHDLETGAMKKDAVMLVENWFPGGHLLFYPARELGMNVIGVGEITKLHKFAWLNQQFGHLQIGQDAYAIVPSNTPSNVKSSFGKYFQSMGDMVQIKQIRSGGLVRYFTIYRFKNCIAIPPKMI